MNAMIKILAGIIGFFVIVLLAVSAANLSKYYLVPTYSGLSIQKGAFAPMGDRQVVFLPNVKAPPSIQAVYEKAEVYPIAFTYFLDRADATLIKQGLDGLDVVRQYLGKAAQFALTPAEKAMVEQRLNVVKFNFLIMEAEMAALSGTEAGLKKATDLINTASALTLNEDQVKVLNLLQKRITP